MTRTAAIPRRTRRRGDHIVSFWRRGALVGLIACATTSPAWSDCDSGDWVTLTAMRVSRQECGAAAIGDTVYVVGGLVPGAPLRATSTVEAYDVARNEWFFAAPVPEALDHMAVVALDGLLYVIGGYARDFGARGGVWVYEPQLDAWTPGVPLPTARAACWAVALGGKIYLFGGVDAGGAVQQSTWIFAPGARVWAPGADMPSAREHLNAVAAGEYIYVIGGRNGPASNANDRYHPATNTWQALAPLPTARSAAAVAALDGRIYVMGGEVPRLHAVNEVYDIASGRWGCAAPMAVPRHGIAAVALADRILAPAGGTVQGLGPTNRADAFVPAPVTVRAVRWSDAKRAYRPAKD